MTKAVAAPTGSAWIARLHPRLRVVRHPDHEHRRHGSRPGLRQSDRHGRRHGHQSVDLVRRQRRLRRHAARRCSRSCSAPASSSSPAERIPADIYFRRNLWLIAFGLFNAWVLLWGGDILYFYGITALFLFAFRNLPARNCSASASPRLSSAPPGAGSRPTTCSTCASGGRCRNGAGGAADRGAEAGRSRNGRRSRAARPRRRWSPS